jgi:hypothetical protein
MYASKRGALMGAGGSDWGNWGGCFNGLFGLNAPFGVGILDNCWRFCLAWWCGDWGALHEFECCWGIFDGIRDGRHVDAAGSDVVTRWPIRCWDTGMEEEEVRDGELAGE